MTDWWMRLSISLCDAILGWTLSLPREMAIVAIGGIVGILMVVCHRLATDQVVLHQTARDDRRLKELIAAARERGNWEEHKRHQVLRRIVAGRRLRAETLSISLSLILLAIVMTWGQWRLQYLPIARGLPFTLLGHFPTAMNGEIVHAVPHPDLSVQSGWIREVTAASCEGTTCGHAEWTFQAEGQAEMFEIILRLRGLSVSHRVSVGTTTYEPPIQNHAGGVRTEVRLTRYRVLNRLPAQIWPGVPGWSIFLSVVTATVYFVGKKFMQKLIH